MTLSSLMVLTSTDDKDKSELGLGSLVSLSNKLDEIIIVLNGEPKEFFLNQFPIIKNFPAGKIKFVTSVDRLCFGPALNLGLEIVKTDWIMRVDPDDVNLEHRIDLFNSMKNLFNFDIYYTSKYIRKVDQNLILKIYPAFTGNYSDFLWLRNPIPHSTVFFSRNAISRLGGYRDISYMEDYDLWIRASSFNLNFFCTNIPTIIFNGDGMKKRRKNLKSLKSEMLIFKSKKDYLNLNLSHLLFSFIIRFFYYLIPSR